MTPNKPLSMAEAANLVQAVIGQNEAPPFATTPMRNGDIGIIMRAEGGIEILSIMPDNPTKENLATLGVRGLFALALFKMAHQTDLMIASVSDASREIGEQSSPTLHS